MPDHKDEAFELQTPISEKGYEMKPGQGIKSGTARDAADMMRVGKKKGVQKKFPCILNARLVKCTVS